MTQTAEIIAIGDEMISGARIDTNSAWLSHCLAEIGWTVMRHTTVPDALDVMVDAIAEAARRARVLVITGGLGPTDDDLTRQALADVAKVGLHRDPKIVDHIRSIFERMGRSMPESNAVQADLPIGSRAISNRFGTAPGIDMTLTQSGRDCRVFCLPGVPAEMQEMWRSHLIPALSEMDDQPGVWSFHTIHCFGAGESQIASMLPGLIERDRLPRVGITASQATISLRIAARGADAAACRQSMQPTIDFIYQNLGNLIFGEGEQTLADVVLQELRRRQWTIAVTDFAFGGEIGAVLRAVDREPFRLTGAVFTPMAASIDAAAEAPNWLVGVARRAAADFESDIGVAISPLAVSTGSPPTFEVAMSCHGHVVQQTCQHAGHPSLRLDRSVKQVLNTVRLALADFKATRTQ